MKKVLLAMLLVLFTLPAFAKKTILILGDSISSGYGINTQKGWVALLEEQLDNEGYDHTVINASISGDTTSNGLARLPNELNTYKPSLTIIELGGNDGLRGIQLSTIKKNLQQIILLCQEANSKVLLLGVRLPPNYGIEYIKQFQDIYTSFAEDDIPVIPNFLNNIDSNKTLMQADGIHPNEAAQPIILSNVWPSIKAEL